MKVPIAAGSDLSPLAHRSGPALTDRTRSACGACAQECRGGGTGAGWVATCAHWPLGLSVRRASGQERSCRPGGRGREIRADRSTIVQHPPMAAAEASEAHPRRTERPTWRCCRAICPDLPSTVPVTERVTATIWRSVSRCGCLPILCHLPIASRDRVILSEASCRCRVPGYDPCGPQTVLNSPCQLSHHGGRGPRRWT
jgi:hypothetical protein